LTPALAGSLRRCAGQGRCRRDACGDGRAKAATRGAAGATGRAWGRRWARLARWPCCWAAPSACCPPSSPPPSSSASAAPAAAHASKCMRMRGPPKWMHAGSARAIARAHLRARMPTRRADPVARESSTVSSDTMRADRRHAHCPKARNATRIAMGEIHASGGARAPARGFRGRRGPIRCRCSRRPPASDARRTGPNLAGQRSSILGIRVARCKEKARVAAEHEGRSLKACDARPRRVQPVRRAVARALAAESRGRRASGSGMVASPIDRTRSGLQSDAAIELRVANGKGAS